MAKKKSASYISRWPIQDEENYHQEEEEEEEEEEVSGVGVEQ
jgi:hypothetical protein